MENIFIDFLPPWVETGLQPAFYDKESGTVLQQTARMYAKVNELIKGFRNQNTIIVEYINKFNDLYNYVHDYFDNLDVQEEINNKLDEMAESGQLADIIAIYLNSNAILAYNTVSELEQAENVVEGSFARIYGKLVYNDGKGAFYKIRAIKNTDVVDGDNIVALPDETLVAEKMPDFEINNINSEITIIKNKIKSIKDYGAVGDGETDDTEAILSALNDLNDGDKLYFPTGDYIVYNDYETNHNTVTEAYPLEKLFRLYQKKNIVIFGDGITSRIRPSYQIGSNENKYSYPCTLTIQNCENIEVMNLTIESKGKNYGDADGTGAGHPDLLATNSGTAILVEHSDGINIHDCSLRLCGSCAVVYYSSISNCKIHDCFINAGSLGYAGVGFDNFAGNGSSYNEKLSVDNCTFHKETLYQPEDGETLIASQTYSSKGAVYTEGSTGNMLECSVTNCTISDCYAGGNASGGYTDGNAIAFATTSGVISNNTVTTSYNAVRLYTWKDGMKVSVTGNNFDTLWNGVIINHNISDNKTLESIIDGNIIKIDTTTGIPDAAPTYLKYHCGVSITGYASYQALVTNNIIEGNHCLRAIYALRLIAKNNKLTGTVGLINRGRNIIFDNNFVQFSIKGIDSDTTHESVNYNTNLSINGNQFVYTENTPINTINLANTAGTTLTLNRMIGNQFRGCFFYVQSMGVEYSMRMSPTSTSLQGSNTLATFTMTDMAFTARHYVIGNDGSIILPSSVQSQSGNTVSLYYHGDVRSKLTNAIYVGWS